MQQRQSRGSHSSRTIRSWRRAIQPVSLRVKLLIGFSIVFSIVFAGSFFWFYTFATEKALSRLKTDMRFTLQGAAAGTDVDELLALYTEGDRNANGFSDDPRYRRQLDWFETVHSIEPRAWLYSYVVGSSDQNRRVGAATTKNDQLEIIYLVDLWANYDPSKAAHFLESDQAGQVAHHVYRDRRLYEMPRIYQDKWGAWLSAAIPLRTVDQQTVIVLGLDIEADYVLQIQDAIRSRVLISFIITYGVLFVLIYILSGVLTQRLSQLTQSAEQIGKGNYGLNLSSLTGGRFPDEMSTLANVFESMVNSIRTRERLIREGKQAEYEMRLALQQERELNELKSRFVSMVSHELRTPLTVIRTSLELLERYGHIASEEKKQEYFQRSRMAVENMTQLLEDVLTLGKAEAGKLDFKPISLDLEQFCQEITQEIQMGIGAKHTIIFQSLMDCEEAVVDPNLLRSILTNLLSNAVKYSAEGSKVEFTLSCLDDEIVFEVRDYGIGIPFIDQPRLFELFHRASNVKMIRGTGLGLAIVKQCVVAHRGRVKFNSQEGVGTGFTVLLPRLYEEAQPDVTPA